GFCVLADVSMSTCTLCGPRVWRFTYSSTDATGNGMSRTARIPFISNCIRLAGCDSCSHPQRSTSRSISHTTYRHFPGGLDSSWLPRAVNSERGISDLLEEMRAAKLGT